MTNIDSDNTKTHIYMTETV